MNIQKFGIFAVTILSISVVVFNNLTQITRELFIPQFNSDLWIGFGIATMVVTAYAVINRNMLK